MTVANKKETAYKVAGVAPAGDRDKLMIEELRAEPDNAERYLKTALKEINKEGGLGGFLIALRRVLEARAV